MRRSVLGLAFALAVTAGQLAWAHPHPPLVVRINPDDRTELLRQDLDSGATRVLYRSTGAQISEVLVSPYYSRVALLETTLSDSGAPLNRLVIVGAGGAILRTVDADVQRVVFSPNGRKLACIVGSFYPGGVGFQPQRTLIVDIDGDTEPVELEGLERAHDLHWLATKNENSIYFKVFREGEDRVLRWDVSQQRLEETAFDGIRFSPDGKYLLRKPYEVVEVGDCSPGAHDDSCLRVTERESGTDLLWLAAQQGSPHGWVYGQGHHLLLIQREPITERVVERRGDRELEVELVRGYSPARGLVYELGTDKPPVEVVGVVGGEGSAGDWVTGVRGVIVQPQQPAGGGSSSDGTLEVCEQLPCKEKAPAGRSRQHEQRVTRLPAPAAERLQPASGAEFQYANPRFRWLPVAGASSYRLDVCRDEACGAKVGGIESVEGTEWRSGGLPVGELFWRVAAIDLSNDGVPTVGEFTSPLKFFVRSDQIDLDPPIPSVNARPGAGDRMIKGSSELYAPAVSIVADVVDAISGVEWWQAQVDGESLQASPEETSATLSGPWSDGAHRIEVRAEDRAGNTSAAVSTRFVVDAKPPRLIPQFVTPETLLGHGDGTRGRPRLFSDDFHWFDLTDGSQLGVTTVFFDHPGRSRGGTLQHQSSDGGFTFRSVWPELVLAVRGASPFTNEQWPQAVGKRLLWLAAVDDGSGVAGVELQATTTGSERRLEIIARDRVGNVSLPFSLELVP